MPQPKILIVDDDANSRAVLCDVLGGEPYTLLEAADGRRALELANEETPDLVLLDVLMPGMDGLGVLHKLKEQETTRSIPVIMVTASNLDALESLCLDGGAMDHIYKPFSSMVVRSRVRAALRSRAVAAGDKPPTAEVFGFIDVSREENVT
jgi:CheY-like chemotaxis protein